MSDTSNIIINYFTWWNLAMRDEDKLTADNFRRFFTEDALLIVNSNLRATGPVGMVPHYHQIRNSVDDVQMVLPVEHEFSTSDSAFVHCHTYVVKNSEQMREEAMAYALITGKLISKLQVVAAK